MSQMPNYKGISPLDEMVTYSPREIESKKEAGSRLDAGKERLDLIPPDALLALAQLYGDGAMKYEDRNWEKGMTWGRCFAPMMRHAWKWWWGEEYDIDPTTGVKTHHLIAVAWNAFTLYRYATTGIGTDDRSKKKTPGTER